MKNEYIAVDELIDDIIQQRRTVAAASFERAHFTTVAPNKRAADDRQHTGSILYRRFTPSQLTVGRLLLQPHQPVTTGLCFDACVKKNNNNNNNKKIKSKMPTTNNDRQHCRVCLFALLFIVL
ncbi:hypothetical protein T4B_4342 [Trichinella pseudospiralis]|uniref:Uncharacterized protein n=1 Tax=Trichinella pseudospiralis TaxID=6337 RepID=A0A0V1IX84_TRIPS|nr:hypothetical protein T4A_1287 [Trichinella pseudospiralis]KRZ27213.1 hypothetical protein T4B_4342 [Trichinella pseudospiralis]